MPTCRQKHPTTHEDLAILYGRKARKLDLYRANLKPDALTLLAGELNSYPELSELILDFCDFRKGFAKALQEFLPKLQFVSVLSFRCTKFDKTATSAVISGLKDASKLVSIDLYSTGITAESMSGLAQSLSALAGLQTLNLSSNKFDPEIAKSLSEYLLKKTASLLELNLENTSLDANITPALFEGLIANQTLKTLVLSNNLFQEPDAKQIKAYLAGIKSLESLSLASIFISADAWKLVGEGLAANSSLQTLCLETNKIETDDLRVLVEPLGKHKTLKRLSLGDNGLDETSGAELAALVSKSTSIESINLRCNFLRPQGIGPLFAALKSNTSLKTLSLRKNQLKNAGAEIVAEYLRTGTSCLEDLDLSSNLIDSGGVALASALAPNKCLRILNLSDNGLGDEFVETLSGSMKENVALEIIVLENNKISNKGATSLAEVVQSGKSLHTLNIENNGLSQFGALTVLRARLDNLRVKVVSSEVKQFITSLG